MVDKITVGSTAPRPADASTKPQPATANMNADVGATVRAGKEDNEDRREATELVENGETEDGEKLSAKERKRQEEKAARDQPKYKEEEIDDFDILEAGGWLLKALVDKNIISRVEALFGVENEAEEKRKAREERKRRKEERKERKADRQDDDE